MKLDNNVKEFINSIGKNLCKRAGLASTVVAFYEGRTPDTNFKGDFDEVVNELGLTQKEINYWEDLWYKRNSRFNKE